MSERYLTSEIASAVRRLIRAEILMQKLPNGATRLREDASNESDNAHDALADLLIDFKAECAS